MTLRLDMTQDIVAQLMFERRNMANYAALLKQIAIEQDAVAVSREHFQSWFRRTRGAAVAEMYPGVAISIVMSLYEGEFRPHERFHGCRVAWAQQQHGFEADQDFIYGEFECEGAV